MSVASPVWSQRRENGQRQRGTWASFAESADLQVLRDVVFGTGGVESLESSGTAARVSSNVQAVIDLYGPIDFQKFVTTARYEHHNRDGSPESKLLGGRRSDRPRRF